MMNTAASIPWRTWTLMSLFLALSFSSFGQGGSSLPSIDGKPYSRLALLVEGGGRAFWYNLGAEARFPLQNNVTAIAQVGLGIIESQVLIPISVGAFIGPGPHHLEVTAGITPLAGTGLSNGAITIPVYDLERVLSHASLGYRWNAERRNFMLRAGYNPLFGGYQGRPFLWLDDRGIQHWFYVGATFDIQRQLRQEPYRRDKPYD